MAQYEQKVSTDRFGNKYILKLAKSVVKRDGTVLDNIHVTYLEIGSKQYKVEISPCNKDTEKKGQSVNASWVKVTEVKKQATNTKF